MDGCHVFAVFTVESRKHSGGGSLAFDRDDGHDASMLEINVKRRISDASTIGSVTILVSAVVSIVEP